MRQENLFGEEVGQVFVHQARLMDPCEVAHNLVGRPDEQRRLHGRWFLCGDITQRFFELAQLGCASLQLRGGAIRAPNANAFAVFTHQVQDCQHRFVVPLFGARVRRCLREMQTHPLGFSLGHDATGWAYIQTPGADMAKDLLPLYALLTDEPLGSKEDVLHDIACVVHDVLRPDLVSTLVPGVEVRDIGVSVLMPEPELVGTTSF